MAPKTPSKAAASAAPQPRRPQIKAPEKQSRLVLALCYIGLPLAIAAFCLGCGGVAVIMDEPDRTRWYSQTPFADAWRWVIAKNPFWMTIFVNGGLIVSLVLGTKLWEHKRAVRAEQQALSSTKARKAE